ncbi:type II toxin-antitoxin system VapB family antitoxin [Glutamicibacter sp. NPDC087344]|uniref:type II toxin-antitoxin system VapB family antitoxin n=1 Tax=Glutamicibacter sp. NPDC087344 TaxID=3363994 RepID=UPI003819F368
MAITSIDIDRHELARAKRLAGTTSNRETVDLALRTLIAVRQQPATVERILSRSFEPDQVDAPTIRPTADLLAAAKAAPPPEITGL